MTITDEENGGGVDTLDAVVPLAADPPPVSPARPIILTNAYFELGGVNLRCLVTHLEVSAETKQVTQTTLCGETDYPGALKYHLKVTFAQSYDTGATYDTLNAAYQAYVANGTPVNFKARPYSSAQAANNPIISGMVIPQAFDLLTGDAGAASEVQIDWILSGPPSVDRGAVSATGAVAGVPGYFTPSGASAPANLAALTAGVTASPATNWTAGQYVITADLLANNWNGTAWVAGKHP